jgi:hypothetical protein
VIFEQSCVLLLHLLQKRQQIAVSLEKGLLGSLRKSPHAMSDKSRPIQPEPGQREFAHGGPWVKAAVCEQQQMAVAWIVAWIPQNRVLRTRRPVGRLVQVALPAAVHQVGRVIGTTL